MKLYKNGIREGREFGAMAWESGRLMSVGCPEFYSTICSSFIGSIHEPASPVLKPGRARRDEGDGDGWILYTCRPVAPPCSHPLASEMS